MYNSKQYEVAYLTGGTTSQIFTGNGTLHAVIVGTTTSTVFNAFDMVNPGTVTNTSTVMVLKASVAEGDYILDAKIANGLYITFGTAGTYTVLWTK